MLKVKARWRINMLDGGDRKLKEKETEWLGEEKRHQNV